VDPRSRSGGRCLLTDEPPMTYLIRSARFAALTLSAAVLAAAPARGQAAAPSASDPGRVWNSAEVTEKPMLINERSVARRVSHGYPKQLLDFGVRGRALLALTVGRDGRVEQVAGVDATHAQFGNVALAFARAMRFAPATVGGVPVRCRVMVPVDFALVNG
jgi:TonB family protein